MGLSLRGTTSGAVDINAPAVAGDNTITLPDNNGAANQFYKNSGTAGIVTYSSMVEDSSGRIGIGTDNPSKSLSILSSQSVMLQLESTSSTARIGFRVPNTSSNPSIGVCDEEDLQFRTGAAERLRITSGGNIGINSTIPRSRLDVVGDLAISNANNQGDIHFYQYGTTNEKALIRMDQASPTAGDLQFWTETGDTLTQRVTINSAGNLVFNQSGNGIDFSATADGSGTSTSELLDDYEEGTWTPSLNKSSSNPTVSYSIRLGTYTKVGRIVTVFFDVTASISGGSGGARIGSLPYTVSSSMAGYSRAHFRASNAVAAGGATEQLTGFVQQGGTYLRLQKDSSGASGYGSGGDANWNSSGRVTGYVTYEV